MSLEQLWLFLSISLIVSASPGPTMLTCMIDAGRYGFRRSMFTMAGACLGNLVLVTISALGLGLLAEHAEWVFHAVKWIGAAYLVYLGIQLLQAKLSRLDNQTLEVRGQHLLGKGFVIAVTNPKGLIYFGALFPQFIDITQPMPPQFIHLTCIFIFMDFLLMCVYALGGRSIMHWLKSPEHQRWFNWISGGVLILAGTLLAFSKF
jgi:homoserine/homoserine lactone efflux protein